MNCNFFRPHKGDDMNGRTPTEAAGITFPASNWGELLEIMDREQDNPWPDHVVRWGSLEAL